MALPGAKRRPALLLGVSLLMSALAAAERLPLRSYGTADGLPSTAIIHILRDTRGFLWFSTHDGLARFDGSRFVTYGTEHGLPVPTVNFTLESRRGGYWVATNGGGVCHLDAEASLPVPPGGAPLFRCLRVGPHEVSNRVDCLVEDRSGRLWAASDGGLFALDPTGSRFDAVDLGVSAPEDSLNTLVEDHEGSLWIGGALALFRRLPGGRIVRYSLGEGRDYVRALLCDRDGRVWIGHRASGRGASGLLVFRPDPAAEAGVGSRRVRVDGDGGSEGAAEVELPAGEPRWPGFERGVVGASVYALLQSADGKVWVGGRDGLSRFDGSRFERVAASDGPLSIDTLAEDSDGNLWIGSGVACTELVRDGFSTFDDAEGPGRDAVRALYENQAGELFAVSGDWRLHRFDGRRFASVRPRAPRRQAGSNSQAAFLDRGGLWWILTDEGLWRLPATRRFEDLDGLAPKVEYGLRDGLPGQFPYRAVEDARGDLWISMQDRTGGTSLARWERATGRFHAQPQVRAAGALNFPSALTEDGRGALWVGFYRGGLGRLREGRFELLEEGEHGAPRGTITALHQDAAGRLWVGSDREGLGRVDDPSAPSPRFVRYGAAQGLSSDNVRCLTSDREGRIYAGTIRGVDRLDPATGAVRHYTTLDGLPNTAVTAALRDRRGDLWFGTPTGLARLTPAPREHRAAPPPVWIAAVRVGGVSQPVSHIGARALSRVVVPPERNEVQIEFGALGFAMGERLQYQYGLDGSDRDWGPLTAERVVHYARLSPGRHRFRVRAVNAEGAPSPEPASVDLTVVPALWQRGSVRGALAALIALGVYAAHRRRLSRAVAVERVRMRIAADLHDEVGSSLSRVAILSEVVKREVGQTAGGAERRLGEIAETSRGLVDALGDVVWSVDPRQDDLGSVVRRIGEFAADVLAGQGMRWELHAPPDLEKVRLDPERRRHLYLILKEAVHNAARHSAGRSLSLRVAVAEGVLTAEVSDDGRGFREVSSDGERAGHGLPNMRARARQLGGELSIDSAAGGTRVKLRMPVRGSSDRMDMRLRKRDRRARMGAP